MRLVGYGDSLSVEQGETIRFMVSSHVARYRARVERLIHGDDNPDGPGFKSKQVETGQLGAFPGERQELRVGSYVRVRADGALALDGSFTIHMWIWPTTPCKERQTLISCPLGDGSCYALRLDAGRLTLQTPGGLSSLARLDHRTLVRSWWSVAAVYEAGSNRARLSVHPADSLTTRQPETATLAVDGPAAASRDATPDSDLLIAAEEVIEGGRRAVRHHFNGKIDGPLIIRGALSEEELEALRAGEALEGVDPLAAWDFGADIGTSVVTDTSANRMHGQTVNAPMRGATGWSWDGSETAWPRAPNQYGAIHFHDDDLDDAAWTPSFAWRVPTECESGVYAVHIGGEGAEDYIPFVVRPRRGSASAPVALLLPTFSYLAYANEHMMTHLPSGRVRRVPPDTPPPPYPWQAQDKYIVANRLNSLYDIHSDDSGVCYASFHRPLLNVRPKYVMPILARGNGSPHQLNADLHLVDWLYEHEYRVDVITDEDLHREGSELLQPYRTVLTGTHSEYWSIEMLEAVQSYIGDGGRLMYLGGNGMYWVTQYDAEAGRIEVRRPGPSTRTWQSEPGEANLSMSGEPGGLWRYRGHPPQRWLGVGFTAQGGQNGEGRPYQRGPASLDERGAWIFDGLEADELIGDCPSLVNGYGAAGFEIDRLDHALGTPATTLLLATASGFSDDYQHVVEEVEASDSMQGGSVNRLVRADMTLTTYPRGGAVFATGSISWCACLSNNGYRNSVATVTGNVLNRFSLDEPLDAPR